MRIITLISMILLLFSGWNLRTGTVNAQPVLCNPSGNVVIFSNYDGGFLDINVDVNIPNLKFGIVSYHADSIVFSGPYAGNISEVRYVGFNAVSACGGHTLTSFTGYSGSNDTIIFAPDVTLTNAHGNAHVICNSSCDTSTYQGGCNTADQISDYFLQVFGGDLYFHKTQYGCWTGTQNLSSGGNCCVGVVFTGADYRMSGGGNRISVFPNPAADIITIKLTETDHGLLKMMNLQGQVLSEKQMVSGSEQMDISGLPAGCYFMTIESAGAISVMKIVKYLE